MARTSSPSRRRTSTASSEYGSNFQRTITHHHRFRNGRCATGSRASTGRRRTAAPARPPTRSRATSWFIDWDRPDWRAGDVALELLRRQADVHGVGRRRGRRQGDLLRPPVAEGGLTARRWAAARGRRRRGGRGGRRPGRLDAATRCWTRLWQSPSRSARRSRRVRSADLGLAVGATWILGTLAPSAEPLVLLHRAPLALLILTYPGARARPVLAVIAFAAPFAPEGAAVTTAVLALVAVAAVVGARRAPAALRAPRAAAARRRRGDRGDRGPGRRRPRRSDLAARRLRARAAGHGRRPARRALERSRRPRRRARLGAGGRAGHGAAGGGAARPVARAAAAARGRRVDRRGRAPGPRPAADDGAARSCAGGSTTGPRSHCSTIPRRSRPRRGGVGGRGGGHGGRQRAPRPRAARPDRAAAAAAARAARRRRRGAPPARARAALRAAARGGGARAAAARSCPRRMRCATSWPGRERSSPTSPRASTPPRCWSAGSRARSPTLRRARRCRSRVAVDDVPLAPPVALTAYYVATEALANVAKHAGASSARIELRAADEHAELRIADDGAGGADPAGGGLSGLRERVRAVDGELRSRARRAAEPSSRRGCRSMRRAP